MEITTGMVKELRERTGAGILDSKKALQDTNGNMDHAIELLREKGLARVAKKAGREAKEGLIVAQTSADAHAALLVEVNCETDFVARTDDFRSLASQVTAHVANANPPLSAPADIKLTEQQQQVIIKLGENVQVRRFVQYTTGDRPGLVETYTHAGGRIAVMVEINSDNPSVVASPDFKALAHDLALQIAAANPRYLKPDDVPAAVTEAERAIYRAQLAEEKKPANVIERIIEGKVQKFYEDICLLKQPFIKDPNLKIEALLKQQSAKLGAQVQISRFVRYELGD